MIHIVLMEYEVHTDSSFVFEDLKIEKCVQVENLIIDTYIMM